MSLFILTLTLLKLEFLVFWSRTETGGWCIYVMMIYICNLSTILQLKWYQMYFFLNQIRQTWRPDPHQSCDEDVLAPTDGGERHQDSAAAGHSPAPGLHRGVQQHCFPQVSLSSRHCATGEKNCADGEKGDNQATTRRTRRGMIWCRSLCFSDQKQMFPTVILGSWGYISST